MADLNFNCPQCGQNLTTDESLSGSEIECPSCSKAIEIPSAGDENVERTEAEPAPPVTAEPEPKKLAVAVHGGGEELLKKSSPHKEKEISGDGRICVKTIKRGDCIELGQDKFDEEVNKFIEKFSREQIISVHSLNYSHFDPGTQKYLPDYAALIVYER
jgi:ribosomal protein S27E